MREALQRGEMEALGHLAGSAQPCDSLTKLMDPGNLVKIMGTNQWEIYAKDENRVAHSFKMRMWGKPTHTYTWGMQGMEPEVGSSILNDPIFLVDEEHGDFLALEPILEEVVDTSPTCLLEQPEGVSLEELYDADWP